MLPSHGHASVWAWSSEPRVYHFVSTHLPRSYHRHRLPSHRHRRIARPPGPPYLLAVS